MVREVDGAWRMTCRWSALQGELESSLGKSPGLGNLKR